MHTTLLTLLQTVRTNTAFRHKIHIYLKFIPKEDRSVSPNLVVGFGPGRVMDIRMYFSVILNQTGTHPAISLPTHTLFIQNY